MKICVICPEPHLADFGSLGDAHLLLCHLVGSNNKYTEFYKSRKELKLLDNGLFEFHKAAPTPEILAKARVVGADVVIAPDVLYNPLETVKNAEQFMREVKIDNSKFHSGAIKKNVVPMAVPQAGNRKDYLWCYKTLVDMGYPWIGLSCLACPNSFKEITNSAEVKINRIMAYRELQQAGLWSDKVNHHLLGLGSFIDEVNFFAPIKSVVSNDSSSAYLHGALGIRYKDGQVPGGKRPEKLDFQKATEQGTFDIIKANIQEWKARAAFESNEYSAVPFVKGKGWF